MTTESDDSSLPSGTPPETGNLLSMNLPIDGSQGTSSPPPSATKEAREKPPTPLKFEGARARFVRQYKLVKPFIA